jgi:hypothetical protein
MKPLDALWPKPLIGHALNQHQILPLHSNCCAILNPLRYLIDEVIVSDMPPNIKIRVPQSEENNEKEMDRHTVFVGADRDRSICHHARVEAEGGG